MITVDMTKAKELSHEWRRNKRAEEFKPYDDVIARQIPGVDADQAEQARATIRTKFETIQTEIDAAGDADTLTTVLTTNGIV